MSAGKRARPALRGVRTSILLGDAPLVDEVLAALLADRPAGQVWSVLDNRPGSVPDRAAADGDDRTSITHLAGGCLCCAGVSLRVTLTRVLRAQRPQRLIILPPPEAVLRELVRQLTDAWLMPVLDLRVVIGLLDAAHWCALPEAQRRERLDAFARVDVLAVTGNPQATACVDPWRQWLEAHPDLALVWLQARRLPPGYLDRLAPGRGVRDR